MLLYEMGQLNVIAVMKALKNKVELNYTTQN